MMRNNGEKREGRAAPYLIGWLVGIPIPILLVIFLLRGCQ